MRTGILDIHLWILAPALPPTWNWSTLLIYYKSYLVTPKSTRDIQSKNTHLGRRQELLCVDYLIDNS